MMIIKENKSLDMATILIVLCIVYQHASEALTFKI